MMIAPMLQSGMPLSPLQTPLIILSNKEHRDGAGKHKRRTAKTDICTITVCIPLDVRLAKQINAHQRNAQIDRLRPYIKYL